LIFQLSRMARHHAVVVVVLATCCSCSASPEVSSDPYADTVSDAAALAADGFESDALADGEITWDEYDTANHLWQTCMTTTFPAETGVEVLLDLKADGTYQYMINVSPDSAATIEPSQLDSVDADCSEGTINLIAHIYNDRLTNPLRKTLREQLFDCLVDGGFIAAGETEKDFEAEWDENDANLSPDDAEGWFADRPEVSDCIRHVAGF
jgi:hypothetical protein